WTTERLLNVARSLSLLDRNTTDDSALVSKLQGYRKSWMNNQPQGAEGLQSGGGVIVSGAAGFYMVSRINMSTTVDLFEEHDWLVLTYQSVITNQGGWYVNSTADWLDGGGGYRNDGIVAFVYQASMSTAQGYPIMWALENATTTIAITERRQTEEEVEQWNALGFSNYFDVGYGADSKANAAYAKSDIHSLPFATRPKSKRNSHYLSVPPAQRHQRLISARSTAEQPLDEQGYGYYDSEGTKPMVFILDSGFGYHPALDNLVEIGISPYASVTDWSYVVPNSITLPRIDPSRAWPENLRDAREFEQSIGHGTQVAMLAVGRTYGIAPDADVFIIKISNNYYDSNGGLQKALIQPGALEAAFEKVHRVVEATSRQGRAVVNLSAGLSTLQTARHPLWQAVFQAHMNEFDHNGVVFVQAAGNHGYRQPHRIWMNAVVPQRFGTSQNSIITVGGTDDHGRYWDATTPEGPPGIDLPGSITIWAQAVDVQARNVHGQETTQTGTSYASPQVAGLAAYALMQWPESFPGTGKEHNLAIKKKLVDMSYRRIPMAAQHTPGDPPSFPMPTDINVAYNNYWGPQGSCDASTPNGGTSGLSFARIFGRQTAEPDDDGYMCPHTSLIATPSPTPTTFVTSINPPSSVSTSDSSITIITTSSIMTGNVSLPTSAITSGATTTAPTRTSNSSSSMIMSSSFPPTNSSSTTQTSTSMWPTTPFITSESGTVWSYDLLTLTLPSDSAHSSSHTTTITLVGPVGGSISTTISLSGPTSTTTTSSGASSQSTSTSSSFTEPTSTTTTSSSTSSISTKPASTASPATSTATGPKPKPTEYHKGDGCGNDDCSSCASDDWHLDCTESDTEWNCACVWQSSCHGQVTGHCLDDCGKYKIGFCDTSLDQVTYPNGKCTCEQYSCREPRGCQSGTICPSGKDPTCHFNEVGAGLTGYCECG
ncbi:hypothetical protein GGR57DRAFT_517700, partial [Xylariaceae sp. FL1272]